jgi:hypothetical protein
MTLVCWAELRNGKLYVLTSFEKNEQSVVTKYRFVSLSA